MDGGCGLPVPVGLPVGLPVPVPMPRHGSEPRLHLAEVVALRRAGGPGGPGGPRGLALSLPAALNALGAAASERRDNITNR